MLSILCLFTIGLATANYLFGPDSSASHFPSTFDAEDESCSEILGFGSAKIEVVPKWIDKDVNGLRRSASKGGEVPAIIYARMQIVSEDPPASEVHAAPFMLSGKPYRNVVGVWMQAGTTGGSAWSVVRR